MKWHQQLRNERLTSNAIQFFKSGDYRSAAISARQALLLNPNNVQATRLMAQLAGLLHSPEEVLWRSQLARIDATSENNLALAAAALEHKEYAVAEQALAALPQEDKQSPMYHKLAGALALEQRLSRVAEIHFRQVAILAPSDEQNQLNLAAVQLLSDDPAARAEGRERLEELSLRPGLELAAIQSLLNDAKREADAQRMLKYARMLLEKEPGRFDFQLEWLEALWMARQPDWESFLTRLQTEAREDAGRAGVLINWLNARGMAAQALTYSRQLPEAVQEIQPVPLGVAEALINLKDWAALERHAAGGQWSGMEFVRAALLARCAAEQERWEKVQSEWNRALREVADDLTRMSMLGRLMEGWGWDSYAEEIWWRIARGNTNPRPALERLFRMYRRHGQSRQLLAVTQRIRELDSSDPIALHNEALLKLLLRAEPQECLKLAREAYEKLRHDASATATLALALERAGKPAEALELLKGLPADKLKQPALAGYYGMMLAANEKFAEAVPFLESGMGAPELLPEERDLIASFLGKARAASR